MTSIGIGQSVTTTVEADRMRAVRIWLYGVALMILATLVLGGVTRLTGSGLSITLWQPISGTIPPLNDAAWQQMFDEFLRSWASTHGDPFVPFDLAHDYPTHLDGKPRYEGVRSFLASRHIDLPDGSPDDPPDALTVDGLGNRKNDLVQQLLRTDGVTRPRCTAASTSRTVRASTATTSPCWTRRWLFRGAERRAPLGRWPGRATYPSSAMPARTVRQPAARSPEPAGGSFYDRRR